MAQRIPPTTSISTPVMFPVLPFEFRHHLRVIVEVQGAERLLLPRVRADRSLAARWRERVDPFVRVPEDSADPGREQREHPPLLPTAVAGPTAPALAVRQVHYGTAELGLVAEVRRSEPPVGIPSSP